MAAAALADATERRDFTLIRVVRSLSRNNHSFGASSAVTVTQQCFDGPAIIVGVPCAPRHAGLAHTTWRTTPGLMATPFLLGLGPANPLALWVSVVIGVAARLLTLFTDHQTGLIRALPYAFHLWADRLAGLVFVAAPFALDFTRFDAGYYWLNGATVLLVTFILNVPEIGGKAMLPMRT
jgi:hypothetical protein